MSTTSFGDRIILKSGAEISGKILKSDEHGIVIDLGFNTMFLPSNEVIKQIAEEDNNNENSAENNHSDFPLTADEKDSQWRLFKSKDLKWGTIGAQSKQYGQGVVMVTTPNGRGSGFLINSDGYLITNYHVIEKEIKIGIVIFNKTDKGYLQEHFDTVKIIALNPEEDLALLKIEAPDTKFKYVYLGDIDEIKTGEQVFAIGNPLGLTRTVSQGIISTTNRNISGHLFIQITTAINPGNSGGPLFNLKGEVIGVTSQGYIYLNGLNFAIPIDVVKRFILNRDAYAFDKDNPNAGFRYLQPMRRLSYDTALEYKLPQITTNSINK